MEKSTPSHVIPMPMAFTGLRIAQLVLAIILLGLSGFLISNVPTDSDVPSSYGLAIFTSIATIIIVIYFIVSSLAAHVIYNIWAWLALEIFSVIFWLCTMATIAAFRASFKIPVVIFRRDFWFAGNTALGVMIAIAILSAFEMILFIVSLALFGVKLHQHISATSANSANPEAVSMTTVPQGQVAPQHAVAPQPQYQQPIAQTQQQYQQPMVQPEQQYQQHQQPQQQFQQPQAQYQQPYQQPQVPYQQAPPHQELNGDGQVPYQQPQFQAPYGGISPAASPPPQAPHH